MNQFPTYIEKEINVLLHQEINLLLDLLSNINWSVLKFLNNRGSKSLSLQIYRPKIEWNPSSIYGLWVISVVQCN